MRASIKQGAAGAFALAAFLFVPAAGAQDEDFHVLDVIEGYWGSVIPAGQDNPEACDQDPLHIWLSEDRRLYYSQQASAEVQHNSPILSSDQRWFLIQYENEERLTEAGEPVAWVLFMDSPDQFRWIRQDWIGTGQSTYPLVRCDDPQIG